MCPTNATKSETAAGSSVSSSRNPGGNDGGTHKGTEVIKDWAYFWRRVWSDMSNRQLLPLKALLFVKFASMMVLYPYITLHMKSLGLVEWEIGINQAILPIVAIFAPPLAGILADKIGNFKYLLAGATAINGVLALLLLLVPKARETIPFPTNMTFTFDCNNEQGSFALSSIGIGVDTCVMDAVKVSQMTFPHSEMKCGLICPVNNDTGTIVQAHSLPHFPNESANEKSILVDGSSFHRNSRFSNLSFFCGKNSSGDCIPFPNDRIILRPEGGVSVKIKNDPSKDSDSQQHFVLGIVNLNGEDYNSQMCAKVSGSKDEATFSNGCVEKCIVQYPRNLFCQNKARTIEYNVSLTFWLYLTFRLIKKFLSAMTLSMVEGAVMAMLKEYKGDYGLQKVCAAFAAITAAPISGYLIHVYGFQPAFYLYAALKIVCAVITLMMNLEFRKPAENVWTNLKSVLFQVEIILFLVAMLFCGSAWGYLETFFFLYLKDLGGTEILMGLCLATGGVMGLPALIFSSPINKRMGHVNVICMGLFFYFVRLFGYSFIENPWLSLIFETMKGITTALTFTAAATYAFALSSADTIASVQGVLAGLSMGIGRSTGSFAGGFLIKWFGQRVTFRIFGLMSVIASVTYVLINWFYIRKRSKVRETLKNMLESGQHENSENSCDNNSQKNS